MRLEYLAIAAPLAGGFGVLIGMAWGSWANWRDRQPRRCELVMVTRGYEGYEQRHRCLLQRDHDAPHDFEGLRPLRSDTKVGIVHSMDVGGSRNIAGQSDIRPDSIVTLKDNGCLNRTGVVLHVAEDRAVVRWRLPIPMVTVDLLSDLVLDVPTISPLAGVVR